MMLGTNNKKGGKLMIKSILIAIDGSESSKSALRVAVDLAKVSGAKLKGLYIENIWQLLEWQPMELMGAAIGATSALPSSKPTIEQVEIEKEFIKTANEIKELVEKETTREGVKGLFIVKRGKVEETIYEFSKTVDLVVMGRCHIEDSKELGSTTETLLRHTIKPVIVVPEGGKLNSNILIAYDGSQAAQRALSLGALFATVLNSKEVKVVSVADNIDSATKPLDEAKEFLSAYNVKGNYIVDFGYDKPWNAILKQVKNFHAGLVVLGAFGENKLLEMIFGSTTKEVLKQTICPVLLIK